MKFLSVLLVTFSSLSYGQFYFQQKVNYRIEVKLDDNNHILHAFESIEYYNNSPDELSFIYMHLWPNAYKNRSTALAKQLLRNKNADLYYAGSRNRGYIDSLDFTVNGERVKWALDSVHIDIAKLYLSKPLKSGEKIIITTPFRVKIPLGIYSRLGHIGQQYQITQWYPKPAVYDKNGWNPMPFLDQGEFYSEFGSFDVSVTLPKNYVVGATGDLVDCDEEKKWLDQKVMESDTISVYNNNNDKFPPSSLELKTLRYRQDNIHDFAWFADKRYHVKKGEVTLQHSGRKVITWIMYTNANAAFWEKAIPYVDSAVYYYSLWNGEYPYNHVTAVDGALSAGGGMEYPNITVIGDPGSDFSLELVIAHEVGHNWFYGILGSNERMHPWIDEGINSFYENRYVLTRFPPDRYKGMNAAEFAGGIGKMFGLDEMTPVDVSVFQYLLQAKRRMDQSVEGPAEYYSDINYGVIVYAKAAAAFQHLFSYLGSETFDKCMQTYFERWKFKHPSPEDLRKVFEEASGKKLDWFFDDLINTTGKIDYKIAGISRRKGIVTIKNKGDIPAPFPLSAFKNDSVIKTIWYEGFSGKKTICYSQQIENCFPSGDYDKFVVDPSRNIPEFNSNNNTTRIKGMFRRTEPLQLKFLFAPPNPNRSQFFGSPALGWNQYNGLMAGAAFFSRIFPPSDFEYIVLPLYASKTKSLAGTAVAGYTVFPRTSVVHHIHGGITFSSYSYTTKPINLNFFRNALYLKMRLHEKEANSYNRHLITIRSVNLTRELPVYSVLLDQYLPMSESEFFFETQYSFKHRHPLLPFDANLNMRKGPGFTSVSIEGKYTFKYRYKSYGAELRFFVGLFPDTPEDDRFQMKLRGWTGIDDYLFDGVFLGRTDSTGILANQFLEKEGAFKMRYDPSSSKGLIAFNIKIPLGNVFCWYTDIGTIAKSDGSPYEREKILMDAGFYLPVIRNRFEIYLSATRLLKNFPDNLYKPEYFVRFQFNIHDLNPYNFLRNEVF